MAQSNPERPPSDSDSDPDNLRPPFDPSLAMTEAELAGTIPGSPEADAAAYAAMLMSGAKGNPVVPRGPPKKRKKRKKEPKQSASETSSRDTQSTSQQQKDSSSTKSGTKKE